MRRRFVWYLPVATALLFASCADRDQSSPTEPPSFSVAPHSGAAASDVRDIQAQIRALFPRDDRGLQHAALKRFRNIVRALRRGRVESARRKTVRFVDFTLRKFQQERLLDPNGAEPPTTEEAVCTLIASMLHLVGLPSPAACPLGPNSAAAVVGRSGGLVVTGAEEAGVDIPRGSLEETVVVTVQLISGPFDESGGPLNTELDQFGPFYQIETFPAVSSFSGDVVVGLCIEELEEGFRLAHNNAEGTGIEILPLAGAPFLDCNADIGSRSIQDDEPATIWGRAVRLAKRLFAPAPLHAGNALIFGGLGGSSGSFSPFGAVDTQASTPDEGGPDDF